MRKAVLAGAVAAAAAAAAAGVMSRRSAVDGATAAPVDSSTAPAAPDSAGSTVRPRPNPPAASAALVSTLSGVYTEQQANAGSDLYAGYCVSCHAGMGNHVGPIFRTSWAGYTLGDMFDYVYEAMPKNAPGSMAPEEYAAVIAYLLKLNGMPAGPQPLPADSEALRQIRVDTAAAKPAG